MQSWAQPFFRFGYDCRVIEKIRRRIRIPVADSQIRDAQSGEKRIEYRLLLRMRGQPILVINHASAESPDCLIPGRGINGEIRGGEMRESRKGKSKHGISFHGTHHTTFENIFG
jgi:hypothetical protein